MVADMLSFSTQFKAISLLATIMKNMFTDVLDAARGYIPFYFVPIIHQGLHGYYNMRVFFNYLY